VNRSEEEDGSRIEELQRRLETRLAELSAAHQRIDELNEKAQALKETKQKLKKTRDERDMLQRSLEWRIGRKIIAPFRKIRKFFRTADEAKRPPDERVGLPWWLQHRPTNSQLEAQRRDTSAGPPLVSVILQSDAAPIDAVAETVASIVAQTCGRWQLLVAASMEKQSALQTRFRDDRIKVCVSVGENDPACPDMATGEFIALLRAGDLLEPHALHEMVQAFSPQTDLIYSDEDLIISGKPCEPRFKPDWSPDLLLSANYLGTFTLIRRTLAEELGGFRPAFAGAEDFDLFLRVTEKARSICHIPKVLWHRARATVSTPVAAAETGALASALQRRGVDAKVEPGRFTGCYRVRYAIHSTRKISVIIPTRDRTELLSRCIESFVAKTAYPHYEIVIIDNNSQLPETLDYLRNQPHRVLSYPGPFNYAAICNYGVRETDGEWILFLNNDTEILDADWLTAMAEHVQRPGVGAVGALLLYPEGTVQHAGVVLREDGIATHAYLGCSPDAESAIQLHTVCNYSAVTGACLLVRREVFERCGGFDEKDFVVIFNDVDFCLRLVEQGFRNIFTPHARLLHHESATRGVQFRPVEAKLMRQRWGRFIAHDPCSNPNLAGPLNLESIDA
jgi:GT2 family glycosyltransferase